MYWYRQAAERGHAVAQNNLAWMYMNGLATLQNIEQAMYWYQKAAEQGHVMAQCSLGHAYANGNCVEKDEEAAVRWFRKAAEQGYENALNNLQEIDTPFAQYTFSLLSHDDLELVKIVLINSKLQKNFFENDLISLIQEKMVKDESIELFIHLLIEHADVLEKNINIPLTNTLLVLVCNQTSGVLQHDAGIASLIKVLLERISLAEIDANQIKPLMYFFCDSYKNDNSAKHIDSLLKLWHRIKSLDIAMNDLRANKFIASCLIEHCFKGKYHLCLPENVEEKDLMTLMYAYEAGLEPSVIKSLLGENLLIEAKVTTAPNEFFKPNALDSSQDKGKQKCDIPRIL